MTDRSDGLLLEYQTPAMIARSPITASIVFITTSYFSTLSTFDGIKFDERECFEEQPSIAVQNKSGKRMPIETVRQPHVIFTTHLLLPIIVRSNIVVVPATQMIAGTTNCESLCLSG